MRLVLFTALLLRCSAADITSFGAHAGDGSDTTPAVREALRTKPKKLVFPKGRYDFYPSYALEKYLFISNNDEGLKRIGFPIVGFEALEIDGQGSQFVFHGFMSPFLIERSKNVTFKNFSIDFERTFHSEAKVIAIGDDGVDLEISGQFPFKVDRGLLQFIGKSKEPYPFGSILEFDPRRRETAYQARDYYTGPYVEAESIGPRKVRIDVPKLTATVGNILVFGAANRNFPGFTISDSIDTSLTDISIYHCGGMGVIAQRSHNVTLDRVQVTPAPSSGRIVSITADATHFVNCTGRIVMTHCLFENQKDDATNIHGIYAQISRQLAPDEIEVRLVHPQQLGFDFIFPKERLELVHGPSMMTYGDAIVKSVTRVNKEFTRVTFLKPLPKELKTGDVVASAQPGPEVLIANCTFRGNRARGLLLGSRGKTIIEDNVFHIPGAAILFEGDARFWFEQAGVRDVTIRRNRFDNCNYGVWGKATIEVAAGIEPSQRAVSRYNRNITIEDNLFRIFDGGRIVMAYSVDGITIRKNRIERTTDYPPARPAAEPFDIKDSSQVAIR